MESVNNADKNIGQDTTKKSITRSASALLIILFRFTLRVDYKFRNSFIDNETSTKNSYFVIVLTKIPMLAGKETLFQLHVKYEKFEYKNK